MNILLADDERFVRLGIINMLNELFPEEMVFVEARNGNEMTTLADSLKPDIIFVDIKMPLKNGVEAMQQLIDQGYEGEFIILTGYAEFSYAQEALRLGVREYLLKPVSIKELEQVIHRVMKRLSQQYQQKNSRFLWDIVQKLYYSDLKRTKHFLLEQTEREEAGKFNGNIFIFNEHSIMAEKLYDRLKRYGQKKLEPGCQYFLFFLESGELIFIMQELERYPVPKQLIRNFIYENRITDFFFESIDFSEIPNKIRWVTKRSGIRMVEGYGKMIWEEEMLPLDWKEEDILEVCKEVENISFAWIEKNKYLFSASVEVLKNNRNILRLTKTMEKNVLFYLKDAVGIPLNLEEVQKIEDIDVAKFDMQFNNRLRKTNQVIKKVKKYMEEHYSEEVSVYTLAEIFDLTPNYLSKIFHQEAGQKFTQYLTEIRISKAKELLLYKPETKVREIGEQVGYYSPRYFSKVFYEATGYLPSEYRDINRRMD